MVNADKLDFDDFREAAIEATNVDGENLEQSLKKIQKRFNLNEQQFQDLVVWTINRYNNLKEFSENPTPAGRERRQTNEYQAIVPENESDISVRIGRVNMTDKEMASLSYMSANTRAKELAESHRLNPYLLTKGGIKKELRRKMETLSKEPGKLLVLVAFDLDDFKIINDLHGHLRGDQILMAMGKALESAMREFDVGAHYSGDEFGFLLEIDTTNEAFDEENVPNIVKRIIKDIILEIQPMVERPENEHGEKDVQEFSAGFKIIQSKENTNLDELLDQADQASLTSKKLKFLRKEAGEKNIGSKDRVVDFSTQSLELANYTEDQQRRALLMSKLRRPIHDAYPTLDTKALSEMIGNFIHMFEASNKLSDFPNDELEDEIKKFIGNILRAQQDNDAAKRFFTKDDINDDKRFSGTKATKDVHKEEEYRIKEEKTIIQKLKGLISKA